MGNQENSVLHANHRSRMRERFIKTEGKGFAEHELMEMLLFYAIPRRDTNPLAHELIAHFGDLKALLNAQYDEIVKLDGVGESVACLLKLVNEIKNVCENYDRKTRCIADYDELGRYIAAKFENANVEKVFVMLFDGKDNILHSEFIGEGNFESVMVNFKRICELVFLKKASKVVIAHNHIDGDINPSDSDMGTTVVLEDFLYRAGAELKEHFIVSDNMYVGLRRIIGKGYHN